MLYTSIGTMKLTSSKNTQQRLPLQKLEISPSSKYSVMILVTLWLTFFLVYAYFATFYGHLSQDVARDFIIVKQHIMSQEWLVHYGPKASVGNFYLPPLYYQIHLILSLLFPSWYTVMTWFVVFFASLSPALLWLVLKDRLPKLIAIAVAVGYGLYWQVIVFSKDAWNPNLIPFFTLVFISSWWKATQSSSSHHWLFGAWLSLFAAVSFHYQAAVLIPFALIMTGYGLLKQPMKRTWLIATPLISSLIFIPLLMGEIQTNFSNTSAILAFFSSEHSLYFDRVSKISYLTTYLPSFVERLMLGIETPFYIFGRVVFFGGFISTLILIMSGRNRSWNAFVLVFLTSILFSLRLFKGDKLDFYLMTLFSMPALLVASLLAVYRRKSVILVASSLLILLPTSISGFQHGLRADFNGFEQLKVATAFISDNVPEKNIRLVFHDLNYANLYYFGITELTDLTLDQNATILVDICKIRDPWCVHGEKQSSSYHWPIDLDVYHYYQQLHQNDYQLVARGEFDDTQIVIGNRVK